MKNKPLAPLLCLVVIALLSTASSQAQQPPAPKEAVWSLADLGQDIGTVALFAASVDGRHMVFGAGRNNWYVHEFDQAATRLRLTYISPRYGSNIAGLTLALAPGGRELVVALENGRLVRYSPATRTQLGEAIGPCSTRGGTGAFTAADLYGGDSIDEQMWSCANGDLVVGSGAAEWTLHLSSSAIYGSRLKAGQLDTDAALEIVTDGGAIIDSVTRTVQWQLPVSGTGGLFDIADIDNDRRNELIFSLRWGQITAYDVSRRLPLWSLTPSHDVGALSLTDVDDDGATELIYGDGQWGEIHVVNPRTRAELGAIDNPEHGITNLAVVDGSGDRRAEIIWGAGASSSGADRLYLANWATRTITWESTQLDGPFLGPVSGDLDGDGHAEVVVVSKTSEASYDSGRIVVLDGRTLAVRGVSPGVAGGIYGWTGVWDVELKDLNGDGRSEILVGTDWLYDGLIEAYSFSTTGAFTRVWTNATRPSGAPFSVIDVVDVDGDGVREVIGGVRTEHTGSQGLFVYAYDIVTGLQRWAVSLPSGTTFSHVEEMIVTDFGTPEATKLVVLVGGYGVYVIDGRTRAAEAFITTTARSMARIGADIILEDPAGTLTTYGLQNGQLVARSSRTVGVADVDGVHLRSDGRLWVASGGTMQLLDAGNQPVLSTANYGSPLGRSIHVAGERGLLLTAGAYGVHGFSLADGFGVAPVPPSHLTLTRYGPTGVILNWTAAPGATSYIVKRGTAPGATTTHAVGITGTSAYIAGTKNTRYYFTVSAVADGIGSANSNEVAVTLTTNAARNDIDGDGVSDLMLYRPTYGNWFSRNSTQRYTIGAGNWNFQWGASGDVPMNGDFDADGKIDPTVFRPSTGQWFILYSRQHYNPAAYGYLAWGATGDVPFAADFDGDGFCDIGVFRPSDGNWYLRLSSQGWAVGAGNWNFAWGAAGDVPITSDLDGDGKADIGVFRPTTGQWFFLLSSTNYNPSLYGYFAWGATGDVNLTADFDGDARSDIGVYRPSTGQWFLLFSSRGYNPAQYGYFAWGASGDEPKVGDWDGDGRGDVAVYRPSGGNWFILYSSRAWDPRQAGVYQWGAPGDLSLH